MIFGMMAGLPVVAQIPEDAIRMSWYTPSGSARQQAIGGAMGSLGGEISAIFVNPAGLGMYKTSEIVLSPGLSLNSSKSSFRGTDAEADGLNRFNLGTSGFVIGYGDPYSRWNSKAFSIAVNRTANFNRNYYYKGLNDNSSFSEPLANQFFDYYVMRKNNNPSIPDEQIIDDALDEPTLSLPARMALYTYLVDAVTDNNTNNVNIISRAEEVGITEQENRIESRGGITELAIGFATNMNDKIYLGGSLGIPIVNYERTTTYTETDATGNDDNDFTYTTLRENYTQKGVGVNAKLGLIFKPAEYVRVGLAIHSPTLYGLKERVSYSMKSVLDNFSGPEGYSVESGIFTGNETPEFKYDLISPWRFIVSGSYVIREISDISRQRGFITADIEYVTHGSSRFHSADDYVDDEEYFKGVNEAVKAAYKGAFNFRVGGELKFNTIMGRLGFAWYGKPYDDDALKARLMNLSGGVGYRNKGIFVDLTYVHSLNKDVHFPYRLEAPRPNTFAELKEGNGNLVLTFGIKL